MICGCSVTELLDNMKLSKGASFTLTALPTQKASGNTSVLLVTEMPSTMLGRPSHTEDLTMIPETESHIESLTGGEAE